MIKSEIVIEQVMHSGELRDAYVAKIDIGDGFKPIMENGGYILKEGYNPILGCPMCSGQGCKSCNQKGTIRGVAKNHLHIVEKMLSDEVKKVNEAILLLNKYK